MSDIKNIFDIAARGMSSQMVRLNTVASNLANSRTVASSDAEAYKAIKAVFKTVYADDVQRTGVSSVDVDEIIEVDRPAEKSFQPGHPKADKDGFIYTAAVNVEEEMVEMLEASRQYENNVEMVSTLRGLMMRTINIGK
ncbi:MAG: flagellar basal body rod protein FlgC [Planktomarina sp.]|jgi:flagellar basal-body rod protein FlgC|nr:flagellar basal body rod protein FlgC [Planktomarina sp.]|tara:strand:+ start:28 stop:444 length:417 start_codon:yes stop_codon:yes gene_type:complete